MSVMNKSFINNLKLFNDRKQFGPGKGGMRIRSMHGRKKRSVKKLFYTSENEGQGLSVFLIYFPHPAVLFFLSSISSVSLK